MEFLEIKGFRKKFRETQVLNGIDFSLQKGKVLVIIGASGSGKTTLLRCLNFLETADEGKIYLGGELFFDAAERYPERVMRAKRRKFGLVFQNFNLFPHFSAVKNVSLPADLAAKERARALFREKGRHLFDAAARREAAAFRKNALAESRGRAVRLLGEVGLKDKLNAYPHELSGGQQQRVAIARAMALEPEVLFLDEPTSALDPELTGEVLRVIRSLKGHTMVIVTHEMAFAREAADAVLFMADGEVAEYGPPEQVLGSPREEKTRAFLRRTGDIT